ncbi:MAG: tocopherol cyclase family protein [Bacteroidota bacterium]
MLKVFKPSLYQGNKRLKKYFEGWYFKQVTADEKKVFSFIPGISLNPNDPHSFIQFIDGITGFSRYIRYDHKSFQYSNKRFEVWVGNSFFSRHKMILDINEEDFNVKAELDYSISSPFPFSLLSPGIMGWYSFVPFMECKHAVVSMNQFVNGQLNINNETINFRNGKSYIEKDWGISFPAAWIWLQSNNFDNPQVSVMLSVAKIPWLRSYFMGFLAFLFIEGQTYLFTTYNKSRLLLKDYNDRFIFIDLLNKEYRLFLKIERRKSGELRAPEKGEMNRLIKESVDSVVDLSLFSGENELIFSGTGRRAGLEVTSNIFELIEKGVG